MGTLGREGFLLLSIAHFEMGDFAAARAMLDKAFLQTVAHGDDLPSERFMMLHAGTLARVEGDRLAALGFHQKALQANCSPLEVIWCLEAIATTFTDYGEAAQALVILASADKERRHIGTPVHLCKRQRHAQQIEALKDALGQAAFASAWAEGQALPIEDAKNRAIAIAAAILGN